MRWHPFQGARLATASVGDRFPGTPANRERRADRRRRGASSSGDPSGAAPIGTPAGEGTVTSAIGWSALGNWSGQLVSLVFFLILTQLLAPGEIGLFALAMVVQAFLGAFVDQSMGEVVIQHPDPSERDLDAAFWLDCLLGVALVSGTLAGAGRLAAAIGHAELEGVVRALCIAVMLGVIGNIPTAILQRRLEFGTAARIAFFSQLVAGTVAVVLAMRGWGVWSLVANQLTETALKTSLTWYRVGWVPRPRIEAASVRSLASYWGHTIGFRLFFFARSNADRLAIGILLGPTFLGFYTTAMRIVRMVVDTFCEGVSKAVLAVLSRMHDDPAGRERGFERLLRLTALTTFPILGGLAVLGPTLVPMLFGAEWVPAGRILPVLCVIGVGIIVLYLHGIMLRAVGQPQVNFAIFAVLTTLDIVLLVALLPHGAALALWAVAVRGLVAMPLYFVTSRRFIGLRASVLLRGLVPGIVASAAVLVCLRVLEDALAGHAPEPARLAASLFAAAAVYGAMVFVFARRDLGFLLGGRSAAGDAGAIGREAARVADCAILVADHPSAIGEPWAELERRGATTPFQTLSWVAAALDTVGRVHRCEPKLVLVRDPVGRPVMLVPLVVRRRSGLRVLEFVDFRISDYNAPLIAPDFADRLDRAGFSALWERILAEIGPVDAIHLEKMPPVVDAVPNPFLGLRTSIVETSYHAALGDDPARYLATRSKTMVGNFRRKRRSLAKLGAVAFRIAADAGEAERLAATMIEWKSWRYRSTGVPDLFAEPAYAEFYRAITRAEWNGTVHASVLEVDGRPISIMWGTRSADRLCILMPAFAAGESSRFSPGQLHILALVDWCGENGVRILDFTWGSEGYKAAWATDAVPLHGFSQGRTLAGRAWNSALVLRRTAYRAAKERLHRHPEYLARAKALRTRLRRRAAGRAETGEGDCA